MAFEIVPYCVDLAEAAVASHSRTFGDIPFCWPVAADALAEPTTLTCSNLTTLRNDLVLAALACGRVVGYVHAAVEDPKPATDQQWGDYAVPQGVLRMFWYERGERAAGEALLQAAEGHLRRQGLERIEVMHCKRGYPWHGLPHAHLTQRAAHLHALLYLRGYVRETSSVSLAWRDAVKAPMASCSVAHTMRREDEPRPGGTSRVLLYAEQSEVFAGMCVGGPLAEFAPDAPEAREWGYIHWLTVAEPFRRRGLAQTLLTAMFGELRREGLRHIALCCIEENAPALLLYANMGFSASDFGYTYVKTLT